MEIIETKMGTFIIRMVKNNNIIDIITDCFNSRLFLYHFPDFLTANTYSQLFLEASTCEEIDECFCAIPTEYSII